MRSRFENLPLPQSRELFHRLFHESSNMMAITTVKDGRFIDLNEASASFGGYKREELIGQSAAKLGLFSNPKERAAMISLLRRDGRVHNLKVRMPSKSGEIHTVLLSADPVTVNDEPCLLSISVDITAREKEDAILRQSEEKYRMLVENSLQGLTIIQDGRFVFCNGAFASMMGYAVEELLSKSAEEMDSMIHPDDRPAMRQRYRDRVAGKPVAAHYEYRGLKKDGTDVWIEAYASQIFYDGKPAVQSAYMDVTERKKAEEALRQSEEALKNSTKYLNQVINCLGDPIFVKDDVNRFVVVNDAMCTFVCKKREELLGRESFQSLPESLAVQLAEQERRVFETGKECVTEEIIPDGEGRPHAMMTKKTLLTEKNGNRQIVGVLRDITEYKHLQAQFLQSQKMEAIGALAGGVAHDFNNLLTVIKGYTELLMEDLEPGDPKHTDLEQIAKAAQQANSLTAQLLAFSRRQILQPELLDLNDVLDEMGKMLRRVIGEDVDLTVITQPGLDLINADPVQIQQIVMNLAVNARDAMPLGGKLTIETANVQFDDAYLGRHPAAVNGDYVMLAISDNGQGMDPNTQARIFEPFFTTKEQGKGTGLGLSTVYGIVKQSNGFIWVYSEPGKGTAFKVYLPRAEGKLAEAGDKIEAESGFSGSETILIAEDEMPVRALAARILRDRGYTVLEAANGMEAVHIAQEYSGKIHLILTDAVMPGISGSTLVSRLEISRPGIRALYISGYPDSSIVHHGILDSNIAFLQKPFTVDGLARKVREVLNSSVKFVKSV